MDPIQAPDLQATQMLMALMGGGPGSPIPIGQQAAAPQSQFGLPPASTAPLANGQNASLGMPGGSSLGTPQDMYAAMMMQTPGTGY